MFDDRQDAGKRLGEALLDHVAGENPLVLAIPRGGIPVAVEAARALKAEVSTLVTRKLPFPDNPESGFGAIAEDGSVYIQEHAAPFVPRETRNRIAAEQRDEIQRRVDVLRGGRPLPDMKGRTVVLVDDGIAMGSTMAASLEMCRNAGAARVVVAAPVSSDRARTWFAERADAAVILECPRDFRAVAQVYRHWHDLTDEEALRFLRDLGATP